MDKKSLKLEKSHNKKFKADMRSSHLRFKILLHLPLLQKNLAGIVNANQDYMRYVSYLNPVIETNVTVERLAIFKKKYYDLANAFRDRLAKMLNTTEDKAYKIQLDVLFYASANAVCCYKNSLVQEALKQINITPPPMDFYKDMRDFLKMRLAWKE